MPASTSAHVQLHAVTSRGPQPLDVPAGARTFHDLLDGLPLGVYSALRTFHHDRFLWLESHLDRTQQSMELLGWPERLDRAALRLALHETARAYPLPDARVRFDVLAQPVERLCGARVVLGLSPFTGVPERFVREGVRIEVARGLARERPLIKTADFVLRRRPFPLESQEAYEHLLLDREGRILECSSSNFHGLRGGVLLTAAGGALEGITQKAVLKVAGGIGVPVERELVSLAGVGRLDEAFLTSSTRGIVPIVNVAGTRVGTGRPGPVTQRLMEGYASLAELEAQPAL